jgi:hypothetical protein
MVDIERSSSVQDIPGDTIPGDKHNSKRQMGNKRASGYLRAPRGRILFCERAEM